MGKVGKEREKIGESFVHIQVGFHWWYRQGRKSPSVASKDDLEQKFNRENPKSMAKEARMGSGYFSSLAYELLLCIFNLIDPILGQVCPGHTFRAILDNSTANLI